MSFAMKNRRLLKKKSKSVSELLWITPERGCVKEDTLILELKGLLLAHWRHVLVWRKAGLGFIILFAGFNSLIATEYSYMHATALVFYNTRDYTKWRNGICAREKERTRTAARRRTRNLRCWQSQMCGYAPSVPHENPCSIILLFLRYVCARESRARAMCIYLSALNYFHLKP